MLTRPGALGELGFSFASIWSTLGFEVVVTVGAVADRVRVTGTAGRADPDRIRHNLKYLESVVPIILSVVLSAGPENELGGSSRLSGPDL